MNDAIQTFLTILRAALKQETPQIKENMTSQEWQSLFQLADIHNVLPLFCEAVYALPSLTAELAMLAAVKNRVRQQVILQSLRTGEFLELNDRLLAAGAAPLVVKGIVCRELYRRPDHRPSSDEDVLIPEAQFALCHRVLSDFGMATDAKIDAFEVPYRKEGSPLYIELHKALFQPENEAYGDLNRFFVNVHDRATAVELQGHTVYTLAPTDHLFYLICHAFKHFLHSGFGIRQVCDIVLYANKYGNEVDWLRILENCKAIRADKFAAALFRIGENHLVFDPVAAAYPAAWQQLDTDELPMLNDLLMGGLYGDASMSRKHSSNITLDAVAAQKSGRKAKSGLLVSVFPPRKKLEGRYPYLKKHPWLLPAAWCSRILQYGKESRNTFDNNAADALRIGAERVELLKIYGILE